MRLKRTWKKRFEEESIKVGLSREDTLFLPIKVVATRLK